MHDSTQELVSLTEAAARLATMGDKVDRSTLSRYVANYADALNPTRRGRETVVDFARLREHRGQNVRLDAKPFVPARSRSDSQARKVDAEAQLRELEVARELAKVTPVGEVAEGAHTAIAAMRAAFDLAINDTAELIGQRLAVEPRLVRPHLRHLAAKALAAFAEDMEALVGGVAAASPTEVSPPPPAVAITKETLP
jgi:hypothetical protein